MSTYAWYNFFGFINIL